MKKFIVLLLALTMVVSVFAACRPNDPQPTKPSSSSSTPKPDPEPVPEEEQLNIDIDSIDYNEDIVTIYHWEPIDCKEFDVTEDEILNNDVNDAVYKKNLYTEQALGIELDFIEGGEYWGYNEIRKYITKLEQLVGDPNTNVDLISASSRMLPQAMVEGYLKDMTEFSDDLDFEKAWWPGEVVDCFSVKNRLYFVSGDISTNLLANLQVIFINKKTLESRGTMYDQLMTDILAGNWTIDDMMVLTEGIHTDNGTAGPSDDDVYGFVTTWCVSDGLYNGVGFEYMKASNNDDEVFKIAPDMLGTSVDAYVTKMVDWTVRGDLLVSSLGERWYKEIFKAGNALFCMAYAIYGTDLKQTDIDFGVAPAPKLNDSQKRYYSSLGTQFCTYGISSFSRDYDRAAQTLQCLGYYAFQNTTPALFEVTFKGKYATDQHTIDTFDLIRDSLIYDPGKIYDTFICGATAWGNYLPNIVSYTIAGGATTDPVPGSKVWGSEFNATKQETVRDLIEAANEKILAFIEQDA